MTTQITLPHLGENIESGDILSILVSEGDVVTAEQDLIEIETDKATLPVPSPQPGKIVKLLVSEGDTIGVGAAILELEEAEATSAPPAPSPEPAPVQEKSPPVETAEAAAPEPVAPVPQPAVQEPPAATPATIEAAAPATPSIDVVGDGRSSAAAGSAR